MLHDNAVKDRRITVAGNAGHDTADRPSDLLAMREMGKPTLAVDRASAAARCRSMQAHGQDWHDVRKTLPVLLYVELTAHRSQ